jgi:hypothetical protein
MIVVRALDQLGADQGPAIEIVAPPPFFASDALNRLLAVLLRARREVDHGQIELELGCDHLAKLAIDDRKTGSKDFVPRNDRIQHAPQNAGL